MAKFNWLAGLALPVLPVFFGACLSPPVETPVNTVTQATPIQVSQNTQNAVDILFMVDNSSSMLAMQNQLQSHFADFLQTFEDLAAKGTYADLHIGVVTSDYGAGDTANPGVGGCDASPGGQRGLMQTLPASYLNKTGCAAPTAVGGATTPFIAYSFQPGGANNLPAGQTGTAGLNQTFTCMASVGAQGCGFEHQLESVYAALQQTTAKTAGGPNGNFLRAEALLTIVFVTNEDDASADPKTAIYRPTGVDGTYGFYDTYRQTHWGLNYKDNGNYVDMPYPSTLPMSGGNLQPIPLDSVEPGPAVNVDGKTDLREYPVDRYISYFQSLKSDPKDVILVGIDGPVTPYQIILAQQTSGQGVKDSTHSSATFTLCSPLAPAADLSGCAVRLNHSCQNAHDPAFFADPPVRLSTVIHNGMNQADEEPICGSDPNAEPDYTAALQKVGQLISSALAPGCIPAKLTSVKDPDCSVQDITTLAGGGTTTAQIPECNTGIGSNNPTYGPAGSATANPCWVVETKAQCAANQPGGSPDGVGLTVYRGSVAAPPNTHAAVACSTIASSSNGDGGT